MSLHLHAPLQGLPLDELVRRASAPPLAAETERSLAREAATGDESAAYDPEKHAGFSTYVRRNIRRAVRAHLFPH